MNYKKILYVKIVKKLGFVNLSSNVKILLKMLKNLHGKFILCIHEVLCNTYYYATQ